MSVQITASQSSSYPEQDNARLAAVMSNGHQAVLTQAAGATDLPHYSTSADGLTWTAQGTLPAAAGLTGISLASIVAVRSLTSGGVEYLAIWFVSGALLRYYTCTWNGSTFSAGQVATAITGSAAIGPATAYWDGTRWYVATFQTSSTYLTVAYLSLNASGLPAGVTAASLVWWGQVGHLDLVGATGSILVLADDTFRGQISLLPFSWTGTAAPTGSIFAVERVGAGNGDVACILDNTGKLDCLWSTGTQLYHVKRTGTSTYSSPPTLLGSSNPTQTAFSAARDSSTNDLWVFYSCALNQTNGEIYLARLSSGQWTTAALAIGGDAAGYQWPRLFAAAGGAANLTYLVGTGATRALWYQGLSVGAAPAAPIGLTTGNIGDSPIALSYTYVNTYPSDPQKYRQIQVADMSATVLWDSGQVATTSTGLNYPGPALTDGTQYQWRVRTWDSISNSGAGTTSPWSAWTTFTPYPGGTVTIVDIYSDAMITSATLEGPSFQIDGTWNQPASDASDQYRAILYQADGSTIFATQAWQIPPIAIASGSSFRTNGWNPNPANGATYVLVLQMRAAVTGLIASSAPLTVVASFAPPPAPTGFTATPDPNAGTVTLAWSNDPAGVSSIVEMQGPDGIWITTDQGVLLTSRVLHPLVGQAYSYRVAIVDSTGLASLWTTATSITLDFKCHRYGVWLNDTVSGDSVAIGVIDDETQLGWDRQLDEKVFNPPGSAIPKNSRGLLNFQDGTLKYKVMGIDVDSLGNPYRGIDIVNALDLMSQRGNTLSYRDPSGRPPVPVKMLKFHWEPYSSTNFRVSFYLRQDFPPNPPFF